MAIYNCRSNNAKADSGYTGSASAAWSINRKPEPSDDPTTPTPGPTTPTPTPEPPIVTIYATKNVSVFGKVGTLYQIDPVGKVGKKFRSSNRKVATVTSTGLVTPKKAGKVKITFKVGKKTLRVIPRN